MELPSEFCRGGIGNKGGAGGSEGCNGAWGFPVRRAAGAVGGGRGDAAADGAGAGAFVDGAVLAGVRSAGAGVGAARQTIERQCSSHRSAPMASKKLTGIWRGARMFPLRFGRRQRGGSRRAIVWLQFGRLEVLEESEDQLESPRVLSDILLVFPDILSHHPDSLGQLRQAEFLLVGVYEDSNGQEFHGRYFLDSFKGKGLLELGIFGKRAEDTEGIMYVLAKLII